MWLLILLTVAVILSWHFSMVLLHSDAVLVKAVEKLRVQKLCSNFLTTGKGTLPIGAPEGLGEIQISILVLLLKTRLSQFVPLRSGSTGFFIYLPSVVSSHILVLLIPELPGTPIWLSWLKSWTYVYFCV